MLLPFGTVQDRLDNVTRFTIAVVVGAAFIGGGGFRPSTLCPSCTICIEIFIRALNTPSLSFLCFSVDRCLYVGLKLRVRRIILLAAVRDDRPCEVGDTVVIAVIWRRAAAAAPLLQLSSVAWR